MALDKSEIISKYEPQRQELVRKYLCLFYIGLPLAIGGIAGFFIVTNIEKPELAIFAIIAAAIGILLLVIYSAKVSKFTKSVQIELKKGIMDAYFPDRKCSSTGWSISEILYPGFFEKPDRYSTSNSMEGTWNGIKFKSSEYTLKRREEHHTKNGTTVTYVTYAQGTMYFFDFEREFGQTLKIIEGGSIFSGHGLKRIKTEYIDFNRKFKTFGSDELHAFYILTPQMQEKIMALEKIYKGQFNMAFIGSDLWLSINDFHKSVTINVKEPFTQEVLDKIEAAIAAPKVIVDNLGLSKEKFKTQKDV